MKIAIASGKGGTGKTTVAVNLAHVIPEAVQLLDCDVEEPNCHLFLDPVIERREPVGVPVPEVDTSKCDACGACGRICQFHAIATLRNYAITFPELCHGCGGCARVCPTGAIKEVQREVGVVESGRSGHIDVVQGRMHIGEAMSPPLIRAVKRRGHSRGITIIDCPPGTSCPVITALKDTDFVLLLTEPTPFGLHDLVLAVETVRQLALPFGVVVNREDAGDNRVLDYCQRETIPILLLIRDDRRIAEAYSRGELAMDVIPKLRADFDRLHRTSVALAKKRPRNAGALTGKGAQ